MLKSNNINTVSFDFSFDWKNNGNNTSLYTNTEKLKTFISDTLAHTTKNNIASTYGDLNIKVTDVQEIKDTVNSRTIVIVTFANK